MRPPSEYVSIELYNSPNQELCDAFLGPYSSDTQQMLQSSCQQGIVMVGVGSPTSTPDSPIGPLSINPKTNDVPIQLPLTKNFGTFSYTMMKKGTPVLRGFVIQFCQPTQTLVSGFQTITELSERNNYLLPSSEKVTQITWSPGFKDVNALVLQLSTLRGNKYYYVLTGISTIPFAC